MSYEASCAGTTNFDGDSSIELKAADGKADSSEVFRELITLSRSEISIALLGQNQTTE
ncbi:phage portal protein family protein, partial [Escherichia coli]